MLILYYKTLDVDNIVNKYKDKIYKLDMDDTNLDENVVIKYITEIKEKLNEFDVVLVEYDVKLQLCFDALKLTYTILMPSKEDLTVDIYDETVYAQMVNCAEKCDSIELDIEETVEHGLSQLFEWIKLEEDVIDVIVENNDMTDTTEPENDESVTVAMPVNKKLTLQDLIEDDIDITEADVRKLKASTNKLKVGMVLQAESRLKLVLKMLDSMNKIGDELVTRINNSLGTSDTASLIYTFNFLSEAIKASNDLTMSLITNEKIQNFFIIDNSNVINITDDRVDINKREKIRKAAEIVLDNYEYFTDGKFDQIINPNTVFDTDAEVISSETANNDGNIQ